MYNYILTVVDTDSVAFSLPDQSEMSEEFRQQLLDEINSKFPELIKYADDGYFQKCVALKAKNYILYDGDKIKIKGSALKATTKCPAMKELLGRFIDTIVKIDDKETMIQELQGIYKNYMLEVHNGITDIRRWCVRKTLSSTMEESERANETKVMDAIKGTDYREGDRFYTFYKSDDTICLAEHFDGDYNKKRLFKNMFDTIKVFSTILPIKDLFINYELKRNQKHLPGYVQPEPKVKEKKPRKPRDTKNKEVLPDVTV